MMAIPVTHDMFVPIIYYTQIRALRTEAFPSWWEQTPPAFTRFCAFHTERSLAFLMAGYQPPRQTLMRARTTIIQ